MGKQVYSRWMSVLMITSLAVMMGYATGESWAAETKYPTRPIQVVIGFTPGSTDVALRLFTDKLQEVLGQPIHFEYKPGAGGAIGASYVAKSKPDGYTFFGCSMSPIITSLLTKEGLDYTLDDFVPICRTAVQPSALAVKADSRWKTLKDFVEEAKRSPGKLTYTTVAVLGTEHIPMEMLQKLGGFKITHVPTTGSGPAVTAVLGGHADMNVQNMVPLSPHLRSGELRALALIGKERFQEFPDVPTLSELGFPITYIGWFGIVGPKGIPGDVLRTIYNACDKTMELYGKSIEDQQRKMLSTPAYIKGEEFGRELRSYYDITKKIIEDLKSSPTK